jgi:hypothetical protein
MITSHIETQEHAQLVAHHNGRKEYQCPYKVTTTRADDDAEDIVEYFDDLGRGLGRTLRYGKRTDASVICTSIAPTRIPQSDRHWNVILTYQPPENDEEPGTDPEGNPTLDPLDRRWQITTGTRNHQVTAWRAWNIDAMPIDGGDSGYQRPLWTLGPVCNSVGTPFDPPLTKSTTETILRITAPMPSFYALYLNHWTNKINSHNHRWSNYLVRYYGFEQQGFERWTVRCESAGANARWFQGMIYYEYSYEFAFRDRANALNPQDGWLESVLDRGLARRAAPGDPDGEGGTISQDGWKAGMAVAAAIRDTEGDPVPELVLLDGSGQPLGEAAASAEGVFIRWRLDPETSFTTAAGFPLDIFE